MGRYSVFGFLFAAVAASQASATGDPELDEIVVTASLRSTSIAELPQSVTVLDQATLRDAGVQHFQDVLGLIPDLNWAAGTSRPRFFQLRGIGEVEQYQGAPNPSVGFLIDDIDFSGVGMPATLFDTQQVEVLRGPQGTAYGANALAGNTFLTILRAREVLASATGSTNQELAAAGDWSGNDLSKPLNDALPALARANQAIAKGASGGVYAAAHDLYTRSVAAKDQYGAMNASR